MKQGKSVKASLEHVVLHPPVPKSSYPTIVALHGRGTDQYDLLPLIEALDIPDMLVISPRAPMSFIVGQFASGYAWYELGEEGAPDPESFQSSFEILSTFMGEIKKAYPIDPERLLLLGFSQGTVMAYAVGLTNIEKVRGIAALSGYVPTRSGLPLKLEGLRNLSVFISHGAWDELIPVELGRESAEILRKAQADVTYHEYQMGHEVREETLHDLAFWTKKIVKDSDSKP